MASQCRTSWNRIVEIGKKWDGRYDAENWIAILSFYNRNIFDDNLMAPKMTKTAYFSIWKTTRISEKLPPSICLKKSWIKEWVSIGLIMHSKFRLLVLDKEMKLVPSKDQIFSSISTKTSSHQFHRCFEILLKTRNCFNKSLLITRTKSFSFLTICLLLFQESR